MSKKLGNTECPIPFLIYDSNNKKFTLTQQGEDVIKSFKTEFGVISVAGMYRTGKSYLINRVLLNRQKGFSVGPTINPCTKGLWIWSKPIFNDFSDSKGTKKKIPILLIDTEGFGALDTDTNHDIRIFTMAILLSSYFLYNSVGGIDESALQNLNFVINLSKFIKLKNNQLETDPEELANLFPSFLWCLRDFGLQLIDENGESITPKEYLEKVLEGTKSSNDPKNKIRKLIKTYFKDRDCFTMVRPLTNEKQLQNLEDLPPEKMRAEFLEQVIQLRKKVLGRVKVKTLNGKALNAEMYLNMIKGLISSFNSGSVPNIENTWKSMCKVESYKAYEEAEAFYEQYVKEQLEENSDLALEDIHKEAKEKSIEIFKKKALGEASQEYLQNLKSKIKEKYSYYSKIQEEETKGKIIRVINKWYGIQESRIQSNEYKNIEEITKDFLPLEEKLNEVFGTYPIRNELFNDFKTRVLTFAGQYFSKKLENEKKYIEEQNQIKINNLKNDLDNMKKKSNKENEKKEIIINQNKALINNLRDELNSVKESLAVASKEKEITENNLNNQLTRMKEEYERNLNTYKKKLNENEEQIKKNDQSTIKVKAEFEKEKALLLQKIEHLQKQIDDCNKREKEYKNDVNNQLKEQSISFKDKIEKYETKIKQLSNDNDSLKEQLLDNETSLKGYETNIVEEKKKNEDLANKYEKEINDLNLKITNLKKENNENNILAQNNYNKKITELQSEISRYKLKINELNVKIKSLEENNFNTKKKFERDLAINTQENNLLKNQNAELNKRISEQKTYYENMITKLENKAFQVDHTEFSMKKMKN